MGLEINRELPSGLVCAYAKVVMTNINWSTGESRVDIGLYKDKATADKGVAAAATVPNHWNGEDFPFDKAEPESIVAVAYDKLKTVRDPSTFTVDQNGDSVEILGPLTWADAKDVIEAD